MGFRKLKCFKFLRTKVERTKIIAFFRGSVSECTHINDQFSQSRMEFLYGLPTQESLDKWQKNIVLLAPLEMK